MNAQSHENLGVVCAVGLFLVFLYHAVKNFRYGPHININNDLFNIAYIEKDDHVNVVVPTVKVKVAQPKPQDTQLFLDCVDALHALGMKKTQAKKIAVSVFNEFNPKSVQDFLMIALRK